MTEYEKEIRTLAAQGKFNPVLEAYAIWFNTVASKKK